MKPSFLQRFSRSLLINASVIVVTVSADHAVAANVTWDLLSAGANNGTITGGTGAWDAATTNWTTDGGVTNVAWSNAGNDTAVFAGTAGTVTLGVPITAGGLTFNSTSYIVTGAQTLTLAGATPTINVGSGLTSTMGSAVLFVIGGTSGLTKSGGGTLTLTSSAVSTYTGSTAVNGGQLSLSFATATPNNLVPSGSALSLNGGAISMLLASGLTKSQTFSGTSLTGGHSAIHMNKNGTGTGALVLGALTRSSGTTVNFGLTNNGGTNTTKNIQSSSFTSGAVINDNGVTYATTFIKIDTGSTGVSPASGNDWAQYNGTTIVAATYTASDSSTLAGNANITSGTDTTLVADTSTTSLRNNVAETRSINLGGFSLTTGGILTTSTVGSNTTTITGGTLKSAASVSGKDLVVFANNTGVINIGASIADAAAGSTGLTKSGPGNLTLSGTNSYTGPTIINSGSLTSVLDAALGTTASVVIGSGAALTVSYGGPSSYTNPQITALLAKTTFTDSTSGFGFDTTDAIGGTADYAGGFIGGTGLAKSGVGTLVLTGANSHTGTTSVYGGTLKVASAAALGGTAEGTVVSNGAAVALDSGMTITGESLSLTGEGVGSTGALRNVSGSNSWTGAITLAGTARINADAGTLSLGAVGASNTLELSGNGNISIAGIVSGTTSVVVDDLLGDGTASGTMTLGGLNTYTGATTVSSGRLDLTGNRTATSGTISVGKTAAKTGTLNISNGNFSTGAGDITAGDAATAVGIINHTAGTISTTPLTANSDGRVLLGGGGTATYNLSGGTLNANGTGSNAFIVGTNSGGVATFNLSGTGALVVAASGGYMQIGRSNSTTAANSGAFIQTGGTASIANLSMGGGSATNVATTGILEITGGTFAVTGTFGALSAGPSCSSSILIGGSADVTLPAFPTVRGGTGPTLATATITFDGGTLHPAAASATYMGNLTSATIQDGGAAFDVASGKNITIAQALLTHNSSLGGGLTKLGDGVLRLSGPNTYTGNTSVNAGTLELADNAQLKFVLGASSGSNNSLTGAGTVTLEGDFVIDTTAADALSTGTWTLENVSSLTGAYGSNFTVVGFTDAGSNKWTKANGAKTYTFDETTGILTLAQPGYASWIDGFYPAETNPLIIGAGADPDFDGIANGVEMVIGGDPKLGLDTALLPTLELVTDPVGSPAIPAGNYLLFTYRRSDLSVAGGVTSTCETDTDLVGTWTTATDGVSGVVVQIDDNYTFTPAAATNTDRVRVYVPQGANTTLFGHLKVVVP